MTHVVAIVPAKDNVESISATVTALLKSGAIGEVFVSMMGRWMAQVRVPTKPEPE